MVKYLVAGVSLFLISATSYGQDSSYGEITHVCRGDSIASTAGYRTGFREKNRLKRFIFFVRDGGMITAREGDSP